MKIRTIVPAVVVFAVVGSALAFKTVNRQTANVFCTDPTTNTCTATALPFARFNGTVQIGVPCDGIHYGFFDMTAPCPQNIAPVFKATQ